MHHLNTHLVKTLDLNRQKVCMIHQTKLMYLTLDIDHKEQLDWDLEENIFIHNIL